MISKSITNSTLRSNVVFSIITVVRNDEARLSQTIKSLKLIYGDERFEHIIVDGLSTDGTANVLKNIVQIDNVKVISGSDLGIYDAMNKGSNLSSGNYALFLNCGDELLALPEQLVQWCKEINSSSVDIACFSFTLQFENSKVHFVPRELTKYKMPTSHQAMIFSKNFIATHPYNIQYKIAGDFDLYLRSSRSRVRIVSDQKPLTLIQGEGYASTNPLTAYREYLEISFKNYHGITCLMALIVIFCKGTIAICIKKILPMKWINYLRVRPIR